MQSGLAASFVTPSPKKNDGNGNQFVNDKPFINKRKPLSMTVAKGVSNNGEHTLIPVTAKMIHSAVWDLERFCAGISLEKRKRMNGTALLD